MSLWRGRMPCIVMVNNHSRISIEVAYASPTEQVVIPCDVDELCTVKQAILESGIIDRFPEIALDQATVGIYSRKVDLDHRLQAGDRVEIYRPLTIDPKKARELRAQRSSSP